MNTNELFGTEHRSKAFVVLGVCLGILIGAVLVAWFVQRDAGQVEVSNVTYENDKEGDYEL